MKTCREVTHLFFQNSMEDVNRDYTFLQMVGQGSFGKVYKAQSKKTGAIYACKEIDYSTMKEKEKELLVHEVNTMKELNHDNIVRYVDRYLDKSRGRLFMIMEYCDNGDLAKYIKRHKAERRYITEDKIWSVAYQLISVMNYCHNLARPGQKIIHRDIKPGNVFLTRDGSIKVGDFGLCRLLDNDDVARTNVGTPLYMAPELLSKSAYTEKADIWSLGCVIYELAALQPPYVASNIESLKLKVRQGLRPPLPIQYSQDLKDMIDSMLSMSPSLRPDASKLIMLPKVQEMQERLTPQPENYRPLRQPEPQR